MPQLNRRRFIQTVSAAGLAPAIPALPAAAAPAAVSHTPFQLAWASYYAGRNNACSVPQIASALNIDPSVAQSLLTEMVKTNVLSAPDIAGICIPRQPLRLNMNGPALVKAPPAPKIKIDVADLVVDDEETDCENVTEQEPETV